MELVFEAKEKKMTLNLYGTKHLIRVPKIKESNELREKLNSADAKDAVQIYFDFFLSVGIPQDALDILDTLDISELVSFLLYPKKS
jgi:hypothetical protein